MSKKLTSTLLLFAVFIGFLWWGLAMLISTLTTPVPPGASFDGESVVYALLLLACSITALVAILRLPQKERS